MEKRTSPTSLQIAFDRLGIKAEAQGHVAVFCVSLIVVTGLLATVMVFVPG